MNQEGRRRRGVIVGGSRGIGAAIGRALAAKGYDLALIHRTPSLASGETVEALQAYGGRVVTCLADLTVPGTAAAALEAAAQALSGVDVVVLSQAEPFQPKLFRHLEAADFDAQWRLSLQASVEILQAAFPWLCKGNSPAVVFVLSSHTLGMPPTQGAAYTVGKYAALGLMRTLAAEWASRRICVNAVSPSFTETDFVQGLPPQTGAVMAERTPLKRLATPMDTAHAVAHLVSPEAAFITGVNLPVAGGGTV